MFCTPCFFSDLLCMLFAFLLLPKIFPTVPKSQSKPEGPVQSKPSKATISIFDDEEEEVSASRSSFKIRNQYIIPNILAFFNDLFSAFCRICFLLCQNHNQLRSKQQCPNPRNLYQVLFLVMMRYGGWGQTQLSHKTEFRFLTCRI